jgi:hypothetical protein
MWFERVVNSFLDCGLYYWYNCSEIRKKSVSLRQDFRLQCLGILKHLSRTKCLLHPSPSGHKISLWICQPSNGVYFWLTYISLQSSHTACFSSGALYVEMSFAIYIALKLGAPLNLEPYMSDKLTGTCIQLQHFYWIQLWDAGLCCIKSRQFLVHIKACRISWRILLPRRIDLQKFGVRSAQWSVLRTQWMIDWLIDWFCRSG